MENIGVNQVNHIAIFIMVCIILIKIIFRIILIL
nr:MAG TPA: hypothetical protein [Bacteriophage sp.]